MENESFECAWGDRLFYGPGPVRTKARLAHSVSHRRNSFDFEFSRSFSTWRFTVRLRSPRESDEWLKVFWNESPTGVKWILCLFFDHFDFTCCYDKVNFAQEIDFKLFFRSESDPTNGTRMLSVHMGFIYSSVVSFAATQVLYSALFSGLYIPFAISITLMVLPCVISAQVNALYHINYMVITKFTGFWYYGSIRFWFVNRGCIPWTGHPADGCPYSSFSQTKFHTWRG